MLKRKIKILSLMITIIISGFLMLSVTYAWYTNNREVEANNIRVKARVSENILISTDSIKWRSAITLDDIINANYIEERKNQIPVNFQAYSSAGELETGLLKMFSGLVSMDKNPSSSNYQKLVLTSTRETEQDGFNGGFLTFDLYFKSDSTRPIYLGKKSYAKYINEKSGIENTLRIAFINEGNILNENDHKSIQALKTDDNANVIIWEPNYDQHTEEAIKNAYDTYGINVTNDFKKLEYYGINNEINNPVLLTDTNGEYFTLMDKTIGTKKNYKEQSINEFLFTLSQGITKIRVYVWVEGQDIDCENSSAGTDFEFNINFTTKVEES